VQSGGARRKFAGGRKRNELKAPLLRAGQTGWLGAGASFSLSLCLSLAPAKGRSHFSVINWSALGAYLYSRNVCVD
jgi:hypothetical protein